MSRKVWTVNLFLISHNCSNWCKILLKINLITFRQWNIYRDLSCKNYLWHHRRGEYLIQFCHLLNPWNHVGEKWPVLTDGINCSTSSAVRRPLVRIDRIFLQGTPKRMSPVRKLRDKLYHLEIKAPDPENSFGPIAGLSSHIRQRLWLWVRISLGDW